MGVCTKLFIDGRYQIADIKKVIERTFETKVETLHTQDANFVQLAFELVNDQKRLVSLFTCHQVNGFTGTLLSLGASGRAVDVMTELAKVFGGFLQEYDCVDEWDGIQGKLYDGDGLPFWIKYAVINGVDHDNIEALGEFIKKTKEKWQK